MKFPIKKQTYNNSISFDDSSLPAGPPLSKERSVELENLIMPKLLAELEILKKTNPLFQKKA